MVCIRDGTASLECPDRSSILVRPAIDDSIGRLVVPSFMVVVAHPPPALLDVVPVGVDVLLDYAQEDGVLRLLVRQRQGDEAVYRPVLEAGAYARAQRTEGAPRGGIPRG